MDDEQFEHLYLASRSRLVGQLWAMTGDLAQAQDCVQEAFVRAWLRRRGLDADGEAWIRTTALRLSVSRLPGAASGLRARRHHGQRARHRRGPRPPEQVNGFASVGTAAEPYAMPEVGGIRALARQRLRAVAARVFSAAVVVATAGLAGTVDWHEVGAVDWDQTIAVAWDQQAAATPANPMWSTVPAAAPTDRLPSDTGASWQLPVTQPPGTARVVARARVTAGLAAQPRVTAGLAAQPPVTAGLVAQPPVKPRVIKRPATRQAADQGSASKPAPAPPAGGGASSSGTRAVTWAKTQIGKPYAWGAAGPGSYDCSGLTGAAWRRAGVTLPRTSRDQYRAVDKIPYSQLRPGDLIFYGDGTNAASIHHVAIYAGGGSMVEAPRAGMDVRLTSVRMGGTMDFAGRP